MVAQFAFLAGCSPDRLKNELTLINQEIGVASDMIKEISPVHTVLWELYIDSPFAVVLTLNRAHKRTTFLKGNWSKLKLFIFANTGEHQSFTSKIFKINFNTTRKLHFAVC